MRGSVETGADGLEAGGAARRVEDPVAAVVEDHDRDAQPAVGERPERAGRVHGRPVADDRDDRAVGRRERRADRHRHPGAERAAARAEPRARVASGSAAGAPGSQTRTRRPRSRRPAARRPAAPVPRPRRSPVAGGRPCARGEGPCRARRGRRAPARAASSRSAARSSARIASAGWFFASSHGSEPMCTSAVPAASSGCAVGAARRRNGVPTASTASCGRAAARPRPCRRAAPARRPRRQPRCRSSRPLASSSVGDRGDGVARADGPVADHDGRPRSHRPRSAAASRIASPSGRGARTRLGATTSARARRRHHVRARDEHDGTARRRERDLERAGHDRRDLLGRAQLPGPLGDGRRDGDRDRRRAPARHRRRPGQGSPRRRRAACRPRSRCRASPPRSRHRRRCAAARRPRRRETRA